MKKTSKNTESKSTLKILYIGNFSSNSVGEPEIARALQRLGHKVKTVGIGFADPKKIREIEPGFDFLLLSKLNVAVPLAARTFMKATTLPTVCWLFDLYWGYRESSRVRSEAHFLADLTITTDGGHDRKWEDVGIRHRTLRQGIEEGIQLGTPRNLGPVEIGFVGSSGSHPKWPFRQQLLKFLRETYGDKFRHFGQDGALRHEKLNDTLASLKIVIGDSVFSPNYWSNRIYEMIGRGGFLIHPKVPGLEHEFEYYEHFIPYNYNDLGGLQQKIDYYLSHDEEREKIRLAGYEHCHKYLTYTKRAEKLIEILREEGII